MNRFKFIFVFLFALPFYGISQKVEKKSYDRLLQGLLKHSVPELSVNEALQKKSPIYLDSRESQEYLVSHIPNAIWIGYDSLRMSTINQLDKSKNYIVYCSVGYRSEKISEKLIGLGFSNVFNLYGGAFEWINEGYALQGIDGKSTQKIHPYNAIWGIWLSKGEKTCK